MFPAKSHFSLVWPLLAALFLSVGCAKLKGGELPSSKAPPSPPFGSALNISPSSLYLLTSGSQAFSAIGGSSPYTYSIVSGGGSINPSTGLYTAPGTPGFVTVRVTDSVSAISDAIVTVYATLAIAPTSATIMVNGTQAFGSTGGVSPITYSVIAGAGSINPSTGLYTAPGTPTVASIRATDATGNTADASVTVLAALAISPASTNVVVSAGTTFSATGGQAPYTYSIFAGGGSINSSSGAFTAPAAPGSVTVRVTDALANTSDATVNVYDALTIAPTSYTIATNDTHTFTASGGVGAKTFSVFAGTGSIDSGTGLYTAPALAGSATVRVTDSIGNTADAAVTIQAVIISPAAINLQTNDTVTFTASGGTPAYTFSMVSGSGTVDPALGDYTAPGSPGTDVVRVTDSLANTADATVTVYDPLSISPTTLTVAITNNYTFVGTGGLGARTFSIVSGTGSINSTTGDYTAGPGAGTDVVRVTDSIGNTADATVTVVAGLTISPTSIKLSINSTKTFIAAAGVPPYTYSIVSGAGSINSSSGLYTAPATTGAVTVRVTDSLLNTSDAAVTIIKPVDIKVGAGNVCVRFDEGSLKCWGDGAGGQLGTGSTADLGDGAGEVGSNLPFIDLGTGRTAKDMAVGATHICAILDTDQVKCWGNNTNGKLGLGDTNNRGDTANEMGDNLPFVSLGTGRTALKIYAAANHTCAILDNSTLKCWGTNTYGQLGQESTAHKGDGANEMGDNLPAVSLGTGRTAKSVALANDTTCVQMDDDSLKCWGRNNRGQTGLGDATTVIRGDGANEMGNNLPFVNLGTGITVQQITAGLDSFCARVTGNAVKCWGRNSAGQLGQGNTTQRGDSAAEMGDNLAYTALGTGLTATGIMSMSNSYCTLLNNGTIKCWGNNTYGQLGQGNTTQRGDGAGEMGDSLATTALGTFTVDRIAASSSGQVACALSTAAQIKCWGRALNGVLANASTTANLGDAGGEMGAALAEIIP